MYIHMCYIIYSKSFLSAYIVEIAGVGIEEC